MTWWPDDPAILQNLAEEIKWTKISFYGYHFLQPEQLCSIFALQIQMIREYEKIID